MKALINMHSPRLQSNITSIRYSANFNRREGSKGNNSKVYEQAKPMPKTITECLKIQ